MQLNWVVIGAVGAAISIGLGAFGAHGLKSRIDVEALALWETAARYLMYASLGLVTIGLLDRQTPGLAGSSGLMLAAGAAVFSATLVALTLGGPRWLGAITPIGGALMIVGWLRLAWGALKSLN